MYNKKQKWNHTVSNFPKGNFFYYIPLQMQKKITFTAHCSIQLKKSRIVQRCALDSHHPIPLWGVADCNRIITVLDGTDIILNQCIMAVKTQ